jgi:uncharacterized protein
MPRPYFDRLSALTDTPAAANIRNRIEGIPSIVDLDVRFGQMDEFGADYRQIVSLPAPPPEDLGSPEMSREMAALANDELAALVAAHPDRFAGWVAAVPMNDPPAAVEEVERAVGLGALGAQIYTNVNGHPLDEQRFDPFWAKMAELDKLIWVHPSRSAAFPDYVTEDKSRYEIWWVFGWPYETAAFMSRIVFSGVFERHPDIKILTHQGGDQLAARTPPDRRQEVEGPELSRRPIDYFRMFYADTALFGAAHALQCAIEFFGVERILFASDSPFDPEKGPGYIRSTIENIDSLGLSDADRDAIYEGNARRVIGL